MSHVGSCLLCPRFLGSDSVASRPKVMVTVGVTPDDSSSPDTVCMDAGYPKVSVSLVGLEVVSVHPPSSVTPPYFNWLDCQQRFPSLHRKFRNTQHTTAVGGSWILACGDGRVVFKGIPISTRIPY